MATVAAAILLVLAGSGPDGVDGAPAAFRPFEAADPLGALVAETDSAADVARTVQLFRSTPAQFALRGILQPVRIAFAQPFALPEIARHATAPVADAALDAAHPYRAVAAWAARTLGAPAPAGEGQGEASAVIGDKWILVSPEDGDDPAGLSDFADKDGLLTSLLSPDGTATVKGTGDVNGTPVVFVDVKSSDGDGTLAFQTVGEPYPVQLTSGDSNGAITFSNWNAPVRVTVPAGAVRPDDLMGTGGASN